MVLVYLDTDVLSRSDCLLQLA